MLTSVLSRLVALLQVVTQSLRLLLYLVATLCGMWLQSQNRKRQLVDLVGCIYRAVREWLMSLLPTLHGSEFRQVSPNLTTRKPGKNGVFQRSQEEEMVW